MNPKPPERGVVSRAGMAVTLQGVRKDMAERGGLSDRFWPFFSMGLESPQKVGLIGHILWTNPRRDPRGEHPARPPPDLVTSTKKSISESFGPKGAERVPKGHLSDPFGTLSGDLSPERSTFRYLSEAPFRKFLGVMSCESRTLWRAHDGKWRQRNVVPGSLRMKSHFPALRFSMGAPEATPEVPLRNES
jgi:hypothetical protein